MWVIAPSTFSRLISGPRSGQQIATISFIQLLHAYQIQSAMYNTYGIHEYHYPSSYSPSPWEVRAWRFLHSQLLAVSLKFIFHDNAGANMLGIT